MFRELGLDPDGTAFDADKALSLFRNELDRLDAACQSPLPDVLPALAALRADMKTRLALAEMGIGEAAEALKGSMQPPEAYLSMAGYNRPGFEAIRETPFFKNLLARFAAEPEETLVLLVAVRAIGQIAGPFAAEARMRAQREMLRAGAARMRGAGEAEMAGLLSPAPGRSYRLVDQAADGDLYVVCETAHYDGPEDNPRFFAVRLGLPRLEADLHFDREHPEGHVPEQPVRIWQLTEPGDPPPPPAE